MERDFLTTEEERGLKSHLNWPVLAALDIAFIVVGLIFLVN